MSSTPASPAFTPERNTSLTAHRCTLATPPHTIKSNGTAASKMAALCDGIARISLVWLLVILLAVDTASRLNGLAGELAHAALTLFLIAAIIGWGRRFFRARFHV